MIAGKDIYNVLAAVVPLYVAMFLAYGSVRWWKLFTPDQCSGINRFVSIFAVPLLSFKFISNNNPYKMNYLFLAADSLQKVVVLVALFLWNMFAPNGSIEWVITVFSLLTLPNTLVMGIPLLEAMYGGGDSGALMVQIVVLQSIIWYTLMLFMFEYRGAKLLISEQFPGTAGSITSLRVDSDVFSLSGRQPLQANAEISDDGKLHVVVRRSTSSKSVVSMYENSYRLNSTRSRASNLTGVEIYSVNSSRQHTPNPSTSFNQKEFHEMFKMSGTYGDTNGLQGNGGDAYSLPKSSSYLHEKLKDGNSMRNDNNNKKKFGGRSMSGESLNNVNNPPLNLTFSDTATAVGNMNKDVDNNKDLHMFVWSSNTSINSASKGAHNLDDNEYECSNTDGDLKHVDLEQNGPSFPTNGPLLTMQKSEGNESKHEKSMGARKMPPASVMTRLILIMVWRKLIRNPNTYSSLIGVIWSLVCFRWGIEMPTIIKGSVSILSNTGLGMAMFSLGLFVALQPKAVACGIPMATYSMAVRFLAGPAIIAATSLAVGLRGRLLHISIVQAALPQAIVPFVFAKEYNVHPDILSTG
ncbi:hypothetical protein C5167_015555 [Papaver somniferum]|uniref:Auxin efflux carrier component n=1 Tax=Papaver somniferum TaxID=3469 RepID=A0A4Y7JAD4_PAPSO|nr:hypothetical protein C5167_015555 [Papaver somniferum]